MRSIDNKRSMWLMTPIGKRVAMLVTCLCCVGFAVAGAAVGICIQRSVVAALIGALVASVLLTWLGIGLFLLLRHRQTDSNRANTSAAADDET